MKITWIKSNYSLKNDEGDRPDIIHGSKQSGKKFIQMWTELTRSDWWCAIYCSETMVHGEGPRQKNTWAEGWQLGKIIGLIRPGGGISNLKERDESGKDRWTISGHLERLEELLESEAVLLAPLVKKTLGPAAWPGKVQHLLRGTPTRLEGDLAALQRELELALAPALARVEAARCP